MDIKALALAHSRSIKELAEKLGQLKGWNIKSAKGALRCLPMVIKQVEEIGKIKQLDGAEKNALAVELIMPLLPLPWWLPEAFVRSMLEAAVSAVVDALKDKF